MDPELRDMFRSLGDQVSDFRRDVNKRFERIEARVFGSEPPIYGNGKHPPVVKRVSQAEGDVAELSGRVMRVEAVAKQTQALLEHNTAETQEAKRLLERNTVATEKIERAFTGVVSNPTVQKIGRVLSWAVLGWLATKGYLHQ
jgi:hypothetical protein